MGHCYNLTRNWIEERAYASLESLTEEERQKQSDYANIAPDTQYSRFAEIDEPLLIKFEDETNSESIFYEGDIFEIDTPQQSEFRLSMNCIPWRINAGTNAQNAEANQLLSPCIGHGITSVEINTFTTDTDPMFHKPFDDKHTQRELVSDITIWLDNEIGIRIEGFIDFCHVSCVDKKQQVLTIPFSELTEAVFNWEDLHIDSVTGFEAETRTFFFGKKGANHIEQPYMSLSSCGSRSVLYIAEEDFCLFGWCISDLFEWFDEYGEYEYSSEQWKAILTEAEKLLSYESFDMLFDYRVSLYRENEDNSNGNYFLSQMNCNGATFWKERGKYRQQLEDMKKWTALVLTPTGTVSISGF